MQKIVESTLVYLHTSNCLYPVKNIYWYYNCHRSRWRIIISHEI